MPTEGTLYRLGRGISEGIIGHRERKDEKKRKWLELAAGIEDIRAGREHESRKFRAEHRLAQDEFALEQEKWAVEFQQTLEDAKRKGLLNEAQIDALKALAEKRRAEAEMAKRMPVSKFKGMTPGEKAIDLLNKESAEILMRSLSPTIPENPPVDWQRREAERYLGFKGTQGEITDQDIMKAYMKLADILTPIRGEPAYGPEQKRRMVNEVLQLLDPTKMLGGRGQAAFPSGQAQPVPKVGGGSYVEPDEEDWYSQWKGQREEPASAAEIESEMPVTGDVTPGAAQPEVLETDTAVQIAQKIIAAKGPLNEEQLTVLERSLHEKMPDKAVQIMDLLRKQSKAIGIFQ